MRVQMELVNRVTDVVVKAQSLPPDGTEVGVSTKVQVELETQDGRGLPWDAALEGLTLKLTPPGALSSHLHFMMALIMMAPPLSSSWRLLMFISGD